MNSSSYQNKFILGDNTWSSTLAQNLSSGLLLVRYTSWSSEILVWYHQIYSDLSLSYLLWFIFLSIHDFYASTSLINFVFLTFFDFLTFRWHHAWTMGNKWCHHLCLVISKWCHSLCSIIKKWCCLRNALSVIPRKRCLVGFFKTCHCKIYFGFVLSVLNA